VVEDGEIVLEYGFRTKKTEAVIITRVTKVGQQMEEMYFVK
jgi:hypothetical protein